MSNTTCKSCSKKLNHPCLTHCSTKCLFANLWNSSSVSGTPIETWDEDEQPWI